jgi:hypothetical protein
MLEAALAGTYCQLRRPIRLGWDQRRFLYCSLNPDSARCVAAHGQFQGMLGRKSAKPRPDRREKRGVAPQIAASHDHLSAGKCGAT